MNIGDAYRKIQNKQLQKRMDVRRRKEMLERRKKQAKKINEKAMRVDLIMASPRK